MAQDKEPISFPDVLRLAENCDRVTKPFHELAEALRGTTDLQFQVAQLAADKERLEGEIRAAEARRETAISLALEAEDAHGSRVAELSVEYDAVEASHREAMTAIETERRGKAAANAADEEAARQRIAGYESREAEAKRAAEEAERIKAQAKGELAAL